MVLNRRLEYGFRGYQVPATPRAARSVRSRGSTTKKAENHKLEAFDVLATVAGELLLENDGHPASSNSSAQQDGGVNTENTLQEEQPGGCGLMEDKPHDHHISAKSLIISEVLPQDHGQNLSCKFKIADGCNWDSGSFNRKLEDEVKTLSNGEQLVSAKASLGSDTEMHIVEDIVVSNAKPISSESSGKAPLCEDHIPYNCFSPVSEDVKVDSRDDDENLYNVSTKKRSFGYATRIGDRRIRKILASKYWKVASRVKDEEVSKHDGDLKGTKWERKNFYKRRGSQRIYPFKKRRIFYIDYGSKYDEKIHSVDGEASAKCLRMHANRQSPSKSGQHSLYIARDSRVKLRIKSFKVPELFFEIAETATVGSLKRMVMEAVRALLGGGLHVGVLLQGKKVRDDSKTLLQTGISRENQQDTLGFTLEPSTSVPPVIPQASPTQIPSSAPQPVNRYPLDSAVHQRASGPLPKPQGNNLIEGDRDSGCIADMAIEQSVTVDSKALVPVPTMSREAIPMVPVQQKDKKPDIVQRRVRRPFSVVEVEALVQAVEKLGTGRWRDVKVQAFDDAKHRTYVDLKDKWKTLVHTARISPQQRRGEPVPQELLDRVLTAHAYWSQHQSKQHHSGTVSSYL